LAGVPLGFNLGHEGIGLFGLGGAIGAAFVIGLKGLEGAVETALRGGLVTQERVEKLDVFFRPEPSVGGQAPFDLIEALEVALVEPVGPGGLVDECGGGGVLRVVGFAPALDGEFELGGIFEGENGFFGAAAVGEPIHGRFGFTFGRSGAGGMVGNFFGRRIVVHGAFEDECGAEASTTEGQNEGKTLISDGMKFFRTVVTGGSGWWAGRFYRTKWWGGASSQSKRKAFNGWTLTARTAEMRVAVTLIRNSNDVDATRCL
jgi:hypothetical protein